MTGKYLTTTEVAELVRTSPATVRYWRYLGRGPTGIKVGKRVLYDADDVRTWLEQHKDHGPDAA
jgi:hypothetical protein